MKISVLMSLYAKEQPAFLRQSLDSIFNQTVRANEIVLVKDGPLTPELDNIIAEYASKYSELKVIALSTNKGLGEALNEGLKHCSFDIVARMDTDDIAVPYRFEKQLEIFSKFPQVDIVSAWIEEFNSQDGLTIAQRKIPEYSFEIYNYGKKRCPINHPVTMFKKNAILFAGGYQPFPLFEDYYLWVRLLLNGTKFYNIQESLLKFRTSPEMYKRRGGIKHALNEIKFQRRIYKLGYISWIYFAFNVAIRFTIRIIPNTLRTWTYQHLLRNNI